MPTGDQYKLSNNQLNSIYPYTTPNYPYTTPNYPYGYYQSYVETTTEETCKYDEKGKLVKKTTKTTTRRRPRSYSPYYWNTYTSPAITTNRYSSSIQPTAFSGD